MSSASPALALALALALPVAATAQSGDLTPEEIAARLEQQYLDAKTLDEQFRGALERGIRLAPAEGTPAPAAQSGGAEIAYSPVETGQMVAVPIVFDLDSAAIRPDQRARLTGICEGLRNAAVDGFVIVGHTDASGSDAYNARLSKLRAEEVKRYMTEECGIPAERLTAIGEGESSPLAGSDPRAAENRRVEFQARLDS